MENKTFNLAMKYTGLALTVFIVVMYILNRNIDLYLLVIPALMMGIDITKIRK